MDHSLQKKSPWFIPNIQSVGRTNFISDPLDSHFVPETDLQRKSSGRDNVGN
jgi:hypothetical protein